MTRLIYVLFALAAFAAPLSALANFTVGQQLSHQLSVCIKKADAVLIADTHADKGFEAAREIWLKLDACDEIPVVGPKVGKVVHSRNVIKDGDRATSSVVEIIHEGKVIAYFLTTKEVTALKKERDS